MQAYIYAMCAISPQNTHEGAFFGNEAEQDAVRALKCIEPTYSKIISPLSLRRLSRIQKMGLASALLCVQKLEGINVDAIITGSAYCCENDMEQFCRSIYDSGEQDLSPISFIKTTNSSIASTIATQLNFSGYCQTYCNRDFSFSNALIDAMLLLSDGDAHCVLVGGIDEYTDDLFYRLSLLNYWRSVATEPHLLIKNKARGTIAGEGACFFALGAHYSDKAIAKILAVNNIKAQLTDNEVFLEIVDFLNANQKQIADLDVCLFGCNGDIQTDAFYDAVVQYIPLGIGIAYYKHLCGEYYTADSFALWIAANIVQTQSLPQVLVGRKPSTNSYNNILIYNYSPTNNGHTMMLISKEV